MESSQETNYEKPEEKVIDNEAEKSKSENVPQKPVSVAGVGTNMSAAPKPRETKKPPKKQARRKNKEQE